MSENIKKALLAIEAEHKQYFIDSQQYGSDPKRERKLRKIRDILRTMA